MKNCIKIVCFLNEVIDLYDRVILVPFEKCQFQFPVSAVYEFFWGAMMNFFKAFFHLEVCWFQENVYVIVRIYIKKCINRYCSTNSYLGGGVKYFFYLLPYNAFLSINDTRF